jgi:hypothetical protein
MANTMIVKVLNGAQNLLDYFGRKSFTKAPVLQLLKQLSAFAELRNKMKVVLVHVDLMKVDDIRMVDFHEDV